ncbi:hypothetical protein EYF80_042217 [Liparis tanakae]|uniref:Uncharacterized protein n=1 Tax=Liparis tanakae TaxID=230148 RepID=A0A4Z2G3F7_9TELE|nr:hypothetical protein EYF80_042217 [Liparis tanakae]
MCGYHQIECLLRLNIRNQHYTGRIVGNGLHAQRQNPEVKVRSPNPTLAEVKESRTACLRRSARDAFRPSDLKNIQSCAAAAECPVFMATTQSGAGVLLTFAELKGPP